ncbi:UDP-glucose:glycoprotein glucosyltransferase-domain-containing protein [Roridomyces roridus]|uniref:UDP-glucose:glycoprotein glucosyltransferase-domain-containing protein n=1 Tax=Roridomyces roridus TaxID=1738132 RepID=A0AAD7F8F2_9AGAR|nr:UDP-glucose:glycoprotein glucosyltransferase-domain-containing protein [Roridomyces roridus]
MRRRAILAACCLAASTTAASPPVKVNLKSSWPAPPLLLEIIETVALENPDAFFPFVHRVTDPENSPSSQQMVGEAVHQFALQVAATHGFLSEGSMSTVEMNLALHAATPKIEAFYQHYQTHTEDPKCGSWVDWYGEVVCDVEKLSHLAGIETIDASNTSSVEGSPTFVRPKLLTFDHVHPPPSRTLDPPSRTAIFYASFDSPNFRELHSYLFALADKPVPSLQYVFRPIPGNTARSEEAPRNFLSGYGVSLDLKKMDYLALDDRNNGNGHSKSTSAASEAAPAAEDPVLSLINAYPEPEEPSTDATLSEEALAAVGFQATQLIADSDEPLATLTQLSQNFPKYMSALSRRVIVNESLQEEVHANQLRAQAGLGVFWFNGAVLQEKEVTPLGLLRLVKKERGVMESLISLGLERAEAMELLTHPEVAAAGSDSGGVLDGVFDASDRPEGGDVIVWWNDIEKDTRYNSWSPSIHALLRPVYPGQFHQVQLNLFNVVLVLDLSSRDSLQTITNAVASIISRNFPFRFGIVPLVDGGEDSDSAKMARLFYHCVKTYGRRRTMGLLRQVYSSFPGNGGPTTLDWVAVRAAFMELVEEVGPPVPVVSEDGETQAEAEIPAPPDFDAIIAAVGDSEDPVQKGRKYVERLGADLASSPTGHGFVNGKHLEMDDLFWRGMQGEIQLQLQHLQEALYSGIITEEAAAESIATYFYDLPTTSLRRNPYIFPKSGDIRVVDVPALFKRTGFRVAPSSFVYPSETEQIPLTIYVVADFDSQEGLGLLQQALLSIETGSKTRLSVVHNPSSVNPDSIARPPVSWLLSHLLGRNLLSKASSTRLLRALGLEFEVPVVPSEGSQIPLTKGDDDLTDGVGLAGYSAEDYDKFVKSSRLVARELQLAPGQQALVVNGRVVGPIKGGDFVSLDFRTLESYELRRRAEPVMKALQSIKPELMQADRASSATLISMATSVLAALQAPEPNGGGIFDAPKRPRNRNYLMLDDQYSSFKYGDNTTALYHIAVIVDPVSEMAQKWSSLLEWIAHIPDMYIKVYTNPLAHQEIPLKRFYRYTLLPSLAFDADGTEIPAQAVFDGLPVEPIYTLGMDVPPSWLVRPREALYDLDNIQLGSLSPQDSSVDAVFALDYLVVEGHARDGLTNAPPRGLQLQLLDGDLTPVDDTQVVANLGYLQFKAAPGVFKLEIREGRGRDIFVMDSVGNEGLDSRTVAEVGDEISVTSFEGLTIYPRFSRVRGMERADVLSDPEEGQDDDEKPSGLLGHLASRVKAIFQPKETATSAELVPVSTQADINIFTVASGLLYERFVSIMILSVLKNTNSTVKFWFIENFLSPSFLEFIPHLAKAYDFQYELVTYKWPSWLRAQKEKQRIIWAYKILFLDVLFPMDLKKVIFVDADQIVRADLQELVDLDLHGAPYGYTPMGDDNTDMEGFRFWKTGYWKEFLQGRPYHISALYVIDLVRFRKLAAGDILRGQYQQLSADPASLANLDQDLPNNLQREVPIYSLPEDWLWCETWCSKDRLHRAKTIDLCQNPLTKEPKLDRARQIPEWEEYDSEIARFASKLAEEGTIRSGIAAVDVNALAGSASPKKDSPDPTAAAVPPAEDVAEAPRDEL